MLSKIYIELFEDAVSDKIRKEILYYFDNSKKEDTFAGTKVLNISDYSIDILNEDGDYEIWNKDVPIEFEVYEFLTYLSDAVGRDISIEILADELEKMFDELKNKEVVILNYYDRMHFSNYESEKSWTSNVSMDIWLKTKSFKYDRKKDILAVTGELKDIDVG